MSLFESTLLSVLQYYYIYVIIYYIYYIIIIIYYIYIKGYVLSGEIALKNNHYYYYYIYNLHDWFKKFKVTF